MGPGSEMVGQAEWDQIGRSDERRSRRRDLRFRMEDFAENATLGFSKADVRLLLGTLIALLRSWLPMRLGEFHRRSDGIEMGKGFPMSRPEGMTGNASLCVAAAAATPVPASCEGSSASVRLTLEPACSPRPVPSG